MSPSLGHIGANVLPFDAYHLLPNWAPQHLWTMLILNESLVSPLKRLMGPFWVTLTRPWLTCEPLAMSTLPPSKKPSLPLKKMTQHGVISYEKYIGLFISKWLPYLDGTSFSSLIGMYKWVPWIRPTRFDFDCIDYGTWTPITRPCHPPPYFFAYNMLFLHALISSFMNALNLGSVFFWKENNAC